MSSLRRSNRVDKRKNEGEEPSHEAKASAVKFQRVGLTRKQAIYAEQTGKIHKLRERKQNEPEVNADHPESDENANNELNTEEDETFHDNHNISAYELERLDNIKKNAQFFKELQINEAKCNFGISSGKGAKSNLKTYGLKREKKLKEALPLAPTRASMRIKRLDPLGVPMPELPSLQQPSLSEQFRQVHNYKQLPRFGLHGGGADKNLSGNSKRKPSGPLDMSSYNNIDADICKKNIQQWSDLSNKYSKEKTTIKTKTNSDLDQYCKSITAFGIADEHALKLTPNRIFSLTMHRMESKLLVIAGGKWGKIGIWDVDSKEGHDGVFLFEPHTRPINVVSVCPADYTKIYSCSYDGTLRCGDLEKQIFTEVYAEPEDEDVSLNAFAWTARSGDTIVVGKNDYTVGVIDIRTGKEENNFVAHGKLVRWIDCHPQNEHLFATSCQDGSVATWDLRKATNINSKLSEIRCSRVTSSVFFSPQTGNKILTTSLDDTIRVYDVNTSGRIEPSPKCMIKHYNQTGRWLTKFRATWDPKTDNCFVVGSMMRPRAINFYTSDGKGSKIAQISHDNFSSITSLNVFHQSLNIVAGGNSSGKVFLWQ